MFCMYRPPLSVRATGDVSVAAGEGEDDEEDGCRAARKEVAEGEASAASAITCIGAVTVVAAATATAAAAVANVIERCIERRREGVEKRCDVHSHQQCVEREVLLPTPFTCFLIPSIR